MRCQAIMLATTSTLIMALAGCSTCLLHGAKMDRKVRTGLGLPNPDYMKVREAHFPNDGFVMAGCVWSSTASVWVCPVCQSESEKWHQQWQEEQRAALHDFGERMYGRKVGPAAVADPALAPTNDGGGGANPADAQGSEPMVVVE